MTQDFMRMLKVNIMSFYLFNINKCKVIHGGVLATIALIIKCAQKLKK